MFLQLTPLRSCAVHQWGDIDSPQTAARQMVLGAFHSLVSPRRLSIPEIICLYHRKGSVPLLRSQAYWQGYNAQMYFCTKSRENSRKTKVTLNRQTASIMVIIRIFLPFLCTIKKQKYFHMLQGCQKNSPWFLRGYSLCRTPVCEMYFSELTAFDRWNTQL